MKTKLSLLLSFFVVALFMANCQQQEQQQSEDTIYVRRLGDDTLSVESLVRDSQSYQGQLVNRMPVTQVGNYQAQLSPDGTVRDFSITWTTPEENPDGPPSRSMNMTINDTVATVQVSGPWGRGGQPVDTTFMVNVPAGTIPSLISGLGLSPPSIATLTQAISQANGNYGNSGYSVNILPPASQRLASGQLDQMGGDTLVATFMGTAFPAMVDDQGQITWLSAMNTTVKTITTRESGDIEQIASRFATEDANNSGMPVASPGATVKATIDGANLEVIYSRPSMRGRTIWGGLVSWNEVWRTGANAATQFTTDQDLEINGTEIPAGTYTLYSIYTPDSAKLIINSQTGQWGTVYNEDQDFARIDMEKTEVAEPQEMFTISFDSTGDTPLMQLTWNTTRYQLPITVQ